MNSRIEKFDYVILGAGIFGLYAAKILLEKKCRVALVERDKEPFGRASYINQARLHYGYHYPRSISTAKQTIKYFERFNQDFRFAMNSEFKKIYAISSRISYTSARQFLKFCNFLKIPAFEIDPNEYFNKGMVEAAFETKEYAFDAKIIKNHLMEKISANKNISVFFNKVLKKAQNTGGSFILHFDDGDIVETGFVLNTTYAAINQIIDKFNYEKFKIKYELCEMIVCTIGDKFRDLGLTVMDGPFLSVMPYGLTKYHTLSVVQYTPVKTSFDTLPAFSCQGKGNHCSSMELENCNICPARPKTTWRYMNQLSKKFFIPDISLTYVNSLYAIKPILEAAEIDDSRPTIIKPFSSDPAFISVLSGKVNGIYEMEEILK